MISSTPAQGQPLDLQYITEMAQSIISLSTQMASNSYATTNILNQEDVKQNDKTSNLSFYAVHIPVVTSKQISVDAEESWSHNFEVPFNNTPIVVVTPVNVGGTPQGTKMSVVISETNSGLVKGTIRFNNKVSGNVTIGLNILALGFNNPITT